MTKSQNSARTRSVVCNIIPTHWLTKVGGAQYQVKQITARMVDSGRYDVHVCSRGVGETVPEMDYQLHNIGNRKGLARYAFFPDAFRLLKQLRKIAPDAIYQRVGCAYTGIAAYFVRKHGGRLVWHIAHENDLDPGAFFSADTPLLKYVEKWIFEYGIRRADAIVAQTREQAALLKKHYGREAVVIPNFHPVPPEPNKQKGGEVQVAWVANFKAWKRPEVFIHLAETLADLSNVKFIMIGMPLADGEKQRLFQQRIDRIENLQFLGAVTQEKVNEVLNDADIFVNTSTSEGFANTFIQAWLRRVPVVSLSVDPDSLLSRGGLGCLAQTEQNLVEKVRELILDQSARLEIGDRARQYAIEHHSIGNIDRLLEVVDGGKGGAGE